MNKDFIYYEIYETQEQNNKPHTYPVYQPTPKFNDALLFLNWVRIGAP